MDKSEFLKRFYTRRDTQQFNEYGYPDMEFEGKPITTEEQWQRFVDNEMDVEEFIKVNREACELAGYEWEDPYYEKRIYPEAQEQLDGIFKSLKALRDAGFDLGEEGNQYVDSIDAIKKNAPKK